MKKWYHFQIIVVLLISMSIMLPFSTKIKTKGNFDDALAETIISLDYSYTVHVPIAISGDTQLNNTAVAGDGSSNSPYILEGWNITSTTNNGISITATTKYFVIRNCWIKTPNNYGISINNVETYTANITNNRITECYKGIYLINAPNSKITNNYCNNASEIGIEISASYGTYLQNNTLVGNRLAAISLTLTPIMEIYDNTILGTTHNGIVFFETESSQIIGNKIINNGGYCLFFTMNSFGNVIHHNYFEDNKLGGTSQAWDDDGNTWYEVATSEGNYWSDWDGIGSYSIAGMTASVDPYPIDLGSPVIEETSDIYYELGSKGNSLEWNITDLDPDTYEIYKDFDLFQSGSWQSGVSIIIDIDGFDVGIYIYQIIVFDQSRNHAFDTVLVNVVDTTSPIITSSPSDLTFDYGTTGNNISWIATDLDPDSYTILMNGTLFTEDNWFNDTEIIIVLDSLNIGSYNCTIVISDGSDNIINDTVIINVEGIIVSEYIFFSYSIMTILTIVILGIYIKRKKPN
ncbi:MAG: right-handed parallel beta-helix repeat-containing protein [Candidatus Heimdallarchaeota archaeon]|nr:right-handed parallel beta-helix repeat-containing protein [Candidatus Heimdallarchaeota archaeon]